MAAANGFSFKSVLSAVAKSLRAVTRPVRKTANVVMRLARAHRHGLSLRRAQDNTAKIRPSDILLVMCLRNELRRLPFFLDYYRRLGVDHFLIVDNDSTDGLMEFLAKQPDCSVWHTKASYLKSGFGMEWCNHLLLRYGTGHLCVTVDPDEFLVYPRMQARSLRDLGQFLKDNERSCMHVLMLDAYGPGKLRDAVLESGDDPFEICPHFDRDGYIQSDGWGGGIFVQGGPRMRVFSAGHPNHAPALNKIPVVWWQRTFTYHSSMHDLSPIRLNQAWGPRNPISITGCLFHFKFVASLEEKAKEEQARKQHYAGGREYAAYRRGLDLVLFEEGVSVRYESPEQLVELGLMSTGGW